ncbi:FCD domain-containing protein [Aurantimonas aggregata]|uniref:FCD domain-containing protein n=1 Tax=Aurantimonas aggregata TaxID=2047720 RepID=A0A6L9MNJ1_9HYPH|nr:GntR family transcriptional regulator [Aurantimonas aggregata]NDV89469.1 FCD domain-containing protein [Aurantimonas aggregata]
MTVATKVQDDTISGRISRALADRIILGGLEPGSRLRQDHIAEEFGASHVPVREAFRRLEAQGLVVSEPRRGVRVAAFDIAAVKEVAEMRAALEVLALRHAAPHLTPAILNAAEKATRQGDKSRDVHSWERANRTFHGLILTPCAMPRLLASIDDLHAASARFLFATWRSDWETPTDKDHRAILDALRQGHVDTASSILARHVQWIGQRPIRMASGKTRDAFAIVG